MGVWGVYVGVCFADWKGGGVKQKTVMLLFDLSIPLIRYPLNHAGLFYTVIEDPDTRHPILLQTPPCGSCE